MSWKFYEEMQMQKEQKQALENDIQVYFPKPYPYINNDIFDNDEQRLSFRRYIESGGGVDRLGRTAVAGGHARAFDQHVVGKRHRLDLRRYPRLGARAQRIGQVAAGHRRAQRAVVRDVLPAVRTDEGRLHRAAGRRTLPVQPVPALA